MPGQLSEQADSKATSSLQAIERKAGVAHELTKNIYLQWKGREAVVGWD